VRKRTSRDDSDSRPLPYLLPRCFCFLAFLFRGLAVSLVVPVVPAVVSPAPGFGVVLAYDVALGAVRPSTRCMGGGLRPSTTTWPGCACGAGGLAGVGSPALLSWLVPCAPWCCSARSSTLASSSLSKAGALQEGPARGMPPPVVQVAGPGRGLSVAWPPYPLPPAQ
jgi:hypothetical protein